jgi:cobyrinic acid a,c-diamide synthase
MKGCVISAPMTGSGKTTVTLGLLTALKSRGIRVQPFKVGPDFIDPGLHEIAAGVASHNLDGWMLARETNEWLFAHESQDRDVAVVEGVMGLFDGLDGTSERGSTAEIAKWLDLPVILVVDAHGMARSAAALVYGFQNLDPEVKISGVLFNRVAGEGHYRILADAVKGVPLLGWLPVDPSIEIPERHLGLLTAKEELAASRIQSIGEFFAKHISVDAILSSVGTVYDRPGRVAERKRDSAQPKELPAPTVRTKRVALAHDRAFSFYYQANRMAFEEAGGEIIEFSPLSDHELPEADLLYIGGGYPELYRHRLEANTTMRASVKRFIESGKKFYAECGGLMYLAESIDESQMVGIVPAKIEMTARLVDFGYCEITTTGTSILGAAGTTARGHQFHYSRASGARGEAYRVRQRNREYLEGFVFPNGIASYIHLHFLSNPAIAKNMLQS